MKYEITLKGHLYSPYCKKSVEKAINHLFNNFIKYGLSLNLKEKERFEKISLEIKK